MTTVISRSNNVNHARFTSRWVSATTTYTCPCGFSPGDWFGTDAGVGGWWQQPPTRHDQSAWKHSDWLAAAVAAVSHGDFSPPPSSLPPSLPAVPCPPPPKTTHLCCVCHECKAQCVCAALLNAFREVCALRLPRTNNLLGVKVATLVWGLRVKGVRAGMGSAW